MFALADTFTMKIDGWRDRLRVAVEESGKSLREISDASGRGKGYMFSILSEGKDPSVENLATVCDVIGVSLTWILYGFDISPETEALMRAAEASPETRAHLLALLAERQKGAP